MNPSAERLPADIPLSVIYDVEIFRSCHVSPTCHLKYLPEIHLWLEIAQTTALLIQTPDGFDKNNSTTRDDVWAPSLAKLEAAEERQTKLCFLK